MNFVPSTFNIRKAERKDVSGVRFLIKGGSLSKEDMDRSLRRRFGENYDIGVIM